MAVYKIFAEKDTTIYSDYPSMNTGMDSILELTKNTSLLYGGQSSAARILIKFSNDDIENIVNNYIGTGSFDAYLKLYLANASQLPTDYTVESYPIYENWDMGTGKFGDSPQEINGASWRNNLANGSNQWIIGSYPVDVTGSYTTSNIGGANWYVSSSATQSFGVYTEKDITLKVTDAINSFISNSIDNNGFIIKTSGSLEFDSAYNYTLNFFSRDTNTIYPPVLELRWDDSSFLVSGSSATPVT